MKKIALIVALLFVPAAHAAFKCVDERGVTHIGDTPPAGCASVVMFEISPSGHILRRIEPTPTADQLRAREEEQRRKMQADKLAGEQRRKDVALLASFASEQEFDTARDRNIEPLTSRIRSAQERIKALEQRLVKIDEEMEFYKAGNKKGAKKEVEVPHLLVAEQERLRNERQTLVASIAGYQKDIESQRTRFDADKKRWLELKRTGLSADASKPAK
jgi:uncharacterized protein DUF4124